MESLKKNGIGKLARVLDKRMNEHGKDDFTPDFGLINGDYSLTLNTFPIPIPAKDYSVCRYLTGIELDTSTETCDVSHHHKVKMPKLQPGDRVLVIWADNEAVVVDVIKKATCLGG